MYIFQQKVMNEEGEIVPGASMPQVDEDTMLRMYENMIRLNVCAWNPFVCLNIG